MSDLESKIEDILHKWWMDQNSADSAAEIAAMLQRELAEAKSSTLAPFNWTEPAKPNETCHYDHVTAETPFGNVRIEWKSWKSYPGYTADTPWGYFASEDTLEEAKEAVRADFESRIRTALRGKADDIIDLRTVTDEEIANIAEARRQAFIEAAEIAANADIELSRGCDGIGSATYEAQEQIAAALRAKAEETGNA